MPYVSGTIHHDLHLWYTCVKGYYLLVLFIFFQILIFKVVSGANNFIFKKFDFWGFKGGGVKGQNQVFHVHQ